MRIALLLALTLAPFAASAGSCEGTPTKFTCREPDGTISAVEIQGPFTTTKGHNPDTGESWSQRSQRSGVLTKTVGKAADGSTWEWTSQTIGNRTFTHGVDSRGRSFSYHCDAFRCY
ncbi:hypothetical protein GI374_13415 [Paracoccus sp. S-4012]|uniref:hypothetical protein n=1 Tax=Paracoccus sp. S-4012 TaxID=2665648 RepID=UPI0012AF976B|nr:hypothetical protein [Paracoccus sp. S-4012]MRX51423.1 hypothetical protein [Paracoccus sp. S-4012]